MKVSVQDKEAGRFFVADLTPRQAARHDNGALVSCGLTAGVDLSKSVLKRWVSQGVAREVSKDTWNHSGCQSSCKLRGGAECRW